MIATHSVAVPTDSLSNGPTVIVIRALLAALQQLGELLRRVDAGQYTRKPVGVVDGSVGGHVRHQLDHFEALLRGVECGTVDYDRRERGTPIESSRDAALAAIDRLVARFSLLSPAAMARVVDVPLTIDAEGTGFSAESTIGREAAFVLSHTIHHNALLAAMCRTLGIELDTHFGFAPSTLEHVRRQACVH